MEGIANKKPKQHGGLTHVDAVWTRMRCTVALTLFQGHTEVIQMIQNTLFHILHTLSDKIIRKFAAILCSDC